MKETGIGQRPEWFWVLDSTSLRDPALKLVSLQLPAFTAISLPG
jgi:hypothetical protein